MKFVDYLFFRLYSFYQNKKNEMPFISSAIFVSIFDFLLLYPLYNGFCYLFIKNNNPVYKYYFIAIILASVSADYLARKDRVIDRFKNSKYNKSISFFWINMIYPIFIILSVVVAKIIEIELGKMLEKGEGIDLLLSLF